MAGLDGAALVAAVGLVGSVSLVLGNRLCAAWVLLASHRSEHRARGEAERLKAEAESLARESRITGRRVDDLAEVRAAIAAMIARAEASREPFDGTTAA